MACMPVTFYKKFMWDLFLQIPRYCKLEHVATFPLPAVASMMHFAPVRPMMASQQLSVLGNFDVQRVYPSPSRSLSSNEDWHSGLIEKENWTSNKHTVHRWMLLTLGLSAVPVCKSTAEARTLLPARRVEHQHGSTQLAFPRCCSCPRFAPFRLPTCAAKMSAQAGQRQQSQCHRC